MKQESKTKIFILLGYVLLAIVATIGVVALYGELQKISTPDETSSKDIITASNVLATLYEAESNGKMIFSGRNIQHEKLRDSLITQVKNEIEILKRSSQDSFFISKLDSVEILLDLKYQNEKRMYLLMDSILKLPANQRRTTTVLSEKDLSDIESVIRSRDMQIMDSTIVMVRQKSFIEKVADIFTRNSKDSISLSSTQKREMIDSLVPINHVRDTIAQYLTDYVFERNLRHSILTSKLSFRQFQMQATNEILLAKINYILQSLEDKDTMSRLKIEMSKKEVLSNSATIGYRVAIGALIIAVLFMALTLYLINKQIRYRKKLETSKSRTEMLLVSREHLMLAISHDIKAPLSSIIGFIELLSKTKLPDKEKYYLQNMQISSEQILELINNLLDFHKLDSGKHIVNSINFSPYLLVNDIYQSFIPIVKSKSIEIKLFNEISSLDIYNSDPFRIKQIINNLVSNAIKFTKEGYVDFSAKITKKGDKQWLIVSIKDTGVGISKEDLQRLFKQYERSRSADIQNIEGFGLGLAISKKLANNFGGDITVESELGVGSTFTLKIPIVPTKSTPEVQKKISQNIGNDSKLRLLFVDDDKVLLNIYFEMLKQMGYEPVLCDKSTKALDELQNNDFDIVFCDIQMPDMNGFELVERIRNAKFSRAKEIPVVALSARSDVSMGTYKEAGFTTFLPKPFTSQQLLSVIANLTGLLENKNIDNLNVKKASFNALIDFAEEDQKAARLILNTFVDENADTIFKMRTALNSNDWQTIKELAHKLLPRMRMINDSEIISILYNIENGEQDAEKLENAIKMIEKRNLEALDFIDKRLKD